MMIGTEPDTAQVKLDWSHGQRRYEGEIPLNTLKTESFYLLTPYNPNP